MADFFLPVAAAYPPGQEWSEWLPFQRSSNLAAARYRIDAPQGVWQVMFGGKPRKPTKKHPHGGQTGLSCYEYGPSPLLTEELYWRWWNQYASGGSAGIFFQLWVKDRGIHGRPLWSQGA